MHLIIAHAFLNPFIRYLLCSTVFCPLTLFSLCFLSYIVGKDISLCMFGHAAHEAWVLVSTISRFWWAPPCASISSFLEKMKTFKIPPSTLQKPFGQELEPSQIFLEPIKTNLAIFLTFFMCHQSIKSPINNDCYTWCTSLMHINSPVSKWWLYSNKQAIARRYLISILLLCLMLVILYL